MSNGVIDTFKLNKMANSLNKIIKIRKKYGNCLDEVQVIGEISIRFSNNSKTLWVMLNGNKYIKFNYGFLTKSIKSFSSGITGGFLDSALSFETTDKSVTSYKYVKTIEECVTAGIPDVESRFIDASRKKWKK